MQQGYNKDTSLSFICILCHSSHKIFSSQIILSLLQPLLPTLNMDPSVLETFPDPDAPVEPICLHDVFDSSVKEAFSKTNFQRKIFFDYDLRTGSWSEFCSRLIPSSHLHQVASTYAFLNFNIWNKLTYLWVNRKNRRVYTCVRCKSFELEFICANPLQPKKEQLWRLVSEDSRVNTTCVCAHHPGDEKQKEKKLVVFDVAVANNPAVRAIVRKGLILKIPTLIKKVKTFLNGLGIPKEFKHVHKTSLQQIVQQLLFIYVQHTRYLYNCLPRYLHYFRTLNHDASVALQADQNEQFYRLFVGFPIAKHYGRLTLPILNVDSFHYQSKQYDGVAVVLTSKTGFGRNIMLAFAIIPVEDTNNMAWFLQMCTRHHIDFSESPLFTDQGPLLSAARQLAFHLNYQINIVLCLQHLIRNVKHKFPMFFDVTSGSTDLVTNCLQEVQAVPTMNLFFDTISQMILRLARIHNKAIDDVVELGLYILQYHPSHWTVFANCVEFENLRYRDKLRTVIADLRSSKYITESLEKTPCTNINEVYDLVQQSNEDGRTFAGTYATKTIHKNPRKCPLFHVSKTNMAESIAALMLACGGRYHIPPLSILYYYEQYNIQVTRLVHDLTVQHLHRITLTSIGNQVRALNAIGDTPVSFTHQIGHSGVSVNNNIQSAIHSSTNSVLSEPGSNADQEDAATIGHGHTTATGLFRRSDKSTYKATLSWYYHNKGKEPPLSELTFEHTCERHIKLSCMMLSPCDCIEKIAYYAKENCKTWPNRDETYWCKFFPPSLHSEDNYQYLHHRPPPGQPSVLENLLLSVPSYEDAHDKSSYKPNPIDSRFSSVDFKQSFHSAPKYKDGFSGRRFRSKGEPNNSSAPVHSKKKNTSSRREGKRKLLSDASIVSSQPAPRNKAMLSKLASDQGQLRFEDDETRKLVAQKICPKSGNKCSICRKISCHQSKCLTLFAWGKDPQDRKTLCPSSYWIYEVPRHLHASDSQPPTEFSAGSTPALEATEGLDTYPHKQPLDKSLLEKSRETSINQLQWDRFNDRNNRRQSSLQQPKRHLLVQPNILVQPIETQKTHSLYEDVDRKYTDQYKGQLKEQRRDQLLKDLLEETPLVTPLQSVAFSYRVPRIAIYAKALNGASKKASVRYPLKTIVAKAFNGVLHEGEVTLYDDNDDLYQIRYQDGDTEQMDPSDIGRYRKEEQIYSTLTENVTNLPTNNQLSQNLSPGSLGDTLTPLLSQKSPDAVSDLMRGRSFNQTRLFNDNQEDTKKDKKETDPTVANQGLNELESLFNSDNDDDSLPSPIFKSSKKKKKWRTAPFAPLDQIIENLSMKPPAKGKKSAAAAKSGVNGKKSAAAAKSGVKRKKPTAAAIAKNPPRAKRSEWVANLVSPTNDSNEKTNHADEGSDNDDDDIPLSELGKKRVKETPKSKDEPGYFDKKPAASKGVEAKSEAVASSSSCASTTTYSTATAFCSLYDTGMVDDFLEIGTEVQWSTAKGRIEEKNWSGTVIAWDTKTKCPVIEHDEFSGINKASLDYHNGYIVGMPLFIPNIQPTLDTRLKKQSSDANCGRCDDKGRECCTPTSKRCYKTGKLCKNYRMIRREEDKVCHDYMAMESTRLAEARQALYRPIILQQQLAHEEAFRRCIIGEVDGTEECARREVINNRNDAEVVDGVEENDRSEVINNRNENIVVDLVDREEVNDTNTEVVRVEGFHQLKGSESTNFILLKFPFVNPLESSAIDAAARSLTELGEGRYPRTRGEVRNLVQINVGDYHRLAPDRGDDSFFNDAIINFWISWITREFRVGRKTSQDILILETSVFQTLEILGSKKCTSLKVMKDNNIFQKRLVLFPIEQNGHWSLCVLVNPAHVLNGGKVDKSGRFKLAGIDRSLPFPCILYFDPIPNQHNAERNSQLIRTWLNDHWAFRLYPKKKPFTEATYPLYKPTVPTQLNQTDCGVFVCRYIFALYKLRDRIFSYADARVHPVPGRTDVQPDREVCWQQLQNSVPFQFDRTDMTRIRDEIKTLVINLHDLHYRWHIKLN